SRCWSVLRRRSIWSSACSLGGSRTCSPRSITPGARRPDAPRCRDPVGRRRRRCRAGSASVDSGLAGFGVDRDLLGVVAGADVELVPGPAVVVLELPAADRPVHLLGRDPAGFVVAHRVLEVDGLLLIVGPHLLVG